MNSRYVILLFLIIPAILVTGCSFLKTQSDVANGGFENNGGYMSSVAANWTDTTRGSAQVHYDRGDPNNGDPLPHGGLYYANIDCPDGQVTLSQHVDVMGRMQVQFYVSNWNPDRAALLEVYLGDQLIYSGHTTSYPVAQWQQINADIPKGMTGVQELRFVSTYYSGIDPRVLLDDVSLV